MISAFDAYTMHRALRLHFTSEKYDYFLYNGKLKTTAKQQQDFAINKQKFFYAKIARHREPELLIVANMLEDCKMFVTSIVGADGIERYNQLAKRHSQLTYRFKEQLEEKRLFERILEVNNELPVLFERYIQGKIDPETIVMIDGVIPCLDKWSTLQHPLVADIQLKLRKYRPFVKYNSHSVKSTLYQLFKGRPAPV